MSLPPQMNLLTLACEDVPRMRAFFEALGGGFTFRDPEGNLWEVAWAESTTVGSDGGLTWF